MYIHCQKEMAETTNQLVSLCAEQADLRHKIWENEVIIQKKQKMWQEFIQASLERKRYILSYFISSITVMPGYNLKIIHTVDPSQ